MWKTNLVHKKLKIDKIKPIKKKRKEKEEGAKVKVSRFHL